MSRSFRRVPVGPGHVGVPSMAATVSAQTPPHGCQRHRPPPRQRPHQPHHRPVSLQLQPAVSVSAPARVQQTVGEGSLISI